MTWEECRAVQYTRKKLRMGERGVKNAKISCETRIYTEVVLLFSVPQKVCFLEESSIIDVSSILDISGFQVQFHVGVFVVGVLVFSILSISVKRCQSQA